MIAFESIDGELIKVLKNIKTSSFGIHQLFGFISEDKAIDRLQSRKVKGFEFDKDFWHCRFNIKQEGKNLNFSDLENCHVQKNNESEWLLSTERGDFLVKNYPSATVSDSLSVHTDKASWMNEMIERLMFLVFLVIPFLYFFNAPSEEVKEEKKKEIKPITVQLIKQTQTVNIAKNNPNIKVKPLTQSQKAKRAVQRNLGFLGLVGSKDLTKAVGGVPQKLKKTTAGAGKGGDAGSGGEVLTGLGKGLKKTTVGNTGVAGLGGVGTKGAGGGAGGYGNTMVASGEGAGISAISMASNDMVLEGGLSRYAINATIAKYLSQVRRCYEQQLNKQPGLEGLVTVAFQINGFGKLNFSKVKNSSLKSPVVEKCITNKMMSWKFPKPKGGVNVNINYPFMLRPVGT